MPRIDDRERALLIEYAEAVGYAFQTTAWKRILLSSATPIIEFTLDSGSHPSLRFTAALPNGSTLRTQRSFLETTTKCSM